MIGDRKHDIDAARANGIDSIGVLYGYGTADELGAATSLAAEPSDITPLVLEGRRAGRSGPFSARVETAMERVGMAVVAPRSGFDPDRRLGVYVGP